MANPWCGITHPTQASKMEKVYHSSVANSLTRRLFHKHAKQFERLKSILKLPSLCTLCHTYHEASGPVCQTCESHFTLLGPACRYCALPLPSDQFLACGQCSIKKPLFDEVAASMLYAEPIRTLLHDFKYKQGLYLSRLMADRMLRHPPSGLRHSECLVPVPMHPKRLRERGYNQAAVLAKRLAKQCHLPCDLSLAKKIVLTESQTQLNASARRKNLAGSFQIKKSHYQHVTVVDDLLTTGSTANELARALKLQGVQTVDVWCFARAP